MKKYSLILITLVMSGSAFASTTGLHTSSLASCISARCTGSSAGNELTQGLVGYDRQVQRVMKQVNEIGPVGAVSYSVQAE